MEPPDFIKADIEGGEIDFLNGAIHTISKFKPDMIIEFLTREALKSGYKFLNNQDYVMLDEGDTLINQTFIDNHLSFQGDCFCFSKGKYN